MAKWDQNAKKTRARDIIERDHALLSSSYTRDVPLVVARASGSEVWDMEGRRYIDMMAGVGVLNVGHRHPRVVEAVREQMERFWHICLSDFYYDVAVDVAERLDQTAPILGPTKYYFGNSGAEAMEAAVKLAIAHTGRQKFIGFLGGFHGRTLGALSLTSLDLLYNQSFFRTMVQEHLAPVNSALENQVIVSTLFRCLYH